MTTPSPTPPESNDSYFDNLYDSLTAQLPYYSCGLDGICEKSQDSTLTLEQCQQQCTSSEKKDLLYTILAYQPEAALSLPPSGQIRVVRGIIGHTTSPRLSHMVLLALKTNDFADLRGERSTDSYRYKLYDPMALILQTAVEEIKPSPSLLFNVASVKDEIYSDLVAVYRTRLGEIEQHFGLAYKDISPVEVDNYDDEIVELFHKDRYIGDGKEYASQMLYELIWSIFKNKVSRDYVDAETNATFSSIVTFRCIEDAIFQRGEAAYVFELAKPANAVRDQVVAQDLRIAEYQGDDNPMEDIDQDQVSTLESLLQYIIEKFRPNPVLQLDLTAMGAEIYAELHRLYLQGTKLLEQKYHRRYAEIEETDEEDDVKLSELAAELYTFIYEIFKTEITFSYNSDENLDEYFAEDVTFDYMEDVVLHHEQQ